MNSKDYVFIHYTISVSDRVMTPWNEHTDGLHTHDEREAFYSMKQVSIVVVTCGLWSVMCCPAVCFNK